MNTNELIQQFLNQFTHETHTENTYIEQPKKADDNNDRCNVYDRIEKGSSFDSIQNT